MQALALGFSKPVINVGELIEHGDVVPAESERGVPFASVCRFEAQEPRVIGSKDTIDQLKEWLTLQIEEEFGLNSMYAVRIDGEFSKVDARSESGTKAHHVFDVSLTQGDAAFCRITNIEIKIPDTPAFDTYALKGASKDEIKSVEQGKG